MRSRIATTVLPRRLLFTRPRLHTPFSAGQPTYETRPHIITQPGDLTPGLSAMEYYERRLELSTKLPAKSLAIIIGNSVKFSSGSVFYDFQQDTDLYYLTGWLEPDSIVVIEKKGDNGADDVLFHMLVPPKNPKKELWEGPKSGLDGAYNIFNADLVEDIRNAPSYLKLLIKDCTHIYWDKKYNLKASEGIKQYFSFSENDNLNELILKSNKHIHQLSPLLADLRLTKSPAEVAVMQKACEISSLAINKAMAKVSTDDPITSEKELASYLEYQFVKGGCEKHAYIPVVANGSNALCMHYTRNDDLLWEDDLVFIDAGGKLGGYCADISRAWPNNQQGFTGPQRDIYEVVLATNKKCIDLCNETLGYSLHDIHEISVNTLRHELNNLPEFKGVTNSEIARNYYPHYIGHNVGLDLHDIPSVSNHSRLRKNQVVTIEPGLYIPLDGPKSYRGIGLRIEDNVVVGQNHEDDKINLTRSCFKEVADVEAAVRGTV
ncbi:Intermediate cleaving peptidase 55 [Candida viswanathii]|uniref:Intermediate cleaving peptidase 55 n=1 Tax=Candida viswanathii TaxID=5486 RepID=A0A367YER3_9ASCO|nr:Intermediate cleaving peptidase 55 [Candida viswanathii]